MSGGTAHETLEERMLHRTLFFSDAVFAIVLTLLALELRPPALSEGLRGMAALQAMSGRILAFALSFGLIAVFWAAHMNTTRRLLRFDWLVAIANLLFLFCVCLLPGGRPCCGRPRARTPSRGRGA